MIKHFKTSTLKDYMSLARELGMLEGKARTDNLLAEWWDVYKEDTCVVWQEGIEGTRDWKVTDYNKALSEGKIVTVYTTDDVLPNDSIRNDKTNNDVKIYHVETQEDYDDLMIKLEEQGYKWLSGDKPTSKYHYWRDDKEDTIVYLNDDGDGLISRGNLKNYRIMPQAKDFIKYKAGDTLELETDKAKELQKYGNQIAKKREDLVNHPLHYNQYSQEVIDTIEEVTANVPVSVAYHVGNAIKYLFRAPFKGKMKQDIEKAVWYLERALTKL